jgi:hypothetical protein
MKLRRWAAVFTGLIWCIPALAQEQFLCIPDQSTGFRFSDGRWARVGFRTEEKYLVRRAKEDEARLPAKWVVIEVGNDFPMTWCEDDFGDGDWLYWDGGLTTWRMSKKTLRFMAVYLYGYVDGKDNNDNTPALYIGKCSAL